MRVTLYTDYALRILMLLAAEPDDLHTIQEISRRYGISRNHLMKVANALVQAGFVEGLRGRSGGLRLAKNADEINLGTIVRTTEDNFDLVECFNRSDNHCIITSACGLRGPLEEALQSFLSVLDGYTLADLVKHPGRLRQMKSALNRNLHVN